MTKYEELKIYLKDNQSLLVFISIPNPIGYGSRIHVLTSDKDFKSSKAFNR